MQAVLKVLLVEDSPDDADLVARRLERAGFQLVADRVEDAAGLHAALDAAEWDIVLADYALPGFSGLDALGIVMERDADMPVVLVSGAIDVTTALRAMKSGAKDFILKGDLERLPSVVERELAEAAVRRDRRLAQQERDRALADLRESNSRLAAFAALTDFPLQVLTRERLIESLLTQIVEALGSDGATLLLVDGQMLVTAGAVGVNAGHVSEIALGSGFSGEIAANNMPAYIRDVQADARVMHSATRDSGMRSMLGVPMHLGERVTGVIHLDWSSTFDPPSWMMPLLEIGADRCAMAIENARLYEREHGIAETLQNALLTAKSQVEGLALGSFYASATLETLVGGDFYDVFETSPGCVALSIGDVSGKGLEAAAVTALVKNTLRAHAIDGDSPRVILAKTSEVVERFTPPEAFASAVLGALDVATGEFVFSTAGHLPPLLVGSGQVRPLISDGPLLGAFPGSLYDEGIEIIQPGELLVLYTDGLTEARSPEGEFYGEQRLRTFLEGLSGLGPQEVAERLSQEMLHFSGGLLRDDIAVLVVQRRGEGD